MHLLNRLVVAAIPAVPKPIVRYFAGRYIAGETVQDAVATVRALNAEGVCATLDVLGEERGGDVADHPGDAQDTPGERLRRDDALLHVGHPASTGTSVRRTSGRF